MLNNCSNYSMENKIVEKLQNEQQETLKNERAVEISKRVQEFLEELEFYAGLFGDYNQHGYDMSYERFTDVVNQILLKKQLNS